MKLYITGHGGHFQGQRDTLIHPRMFTPVHQPQKGLCANTQPGIIDSGAFSDNTRNRLSHEAALTRQLKWEATTAEHWNSPGWQAEGIVSYDLLIDETWTDNRRAKARWSTQDAEAAVQETILAAHYLTSQRKRLGNRTLILSAQGVNPEQYERCIKGLLQASEPQDWIGLGGWCIIGRQRSLLTTFNETLERCLPLIAQNGHQHVHIFGVLWLPALQALTTHAAAAGLTTSTDSTKPVMDCCCNPKWHKKSGARAPHWRDNVQWWNTSLKNLSA